MLILVLSLCIFYVAGAGDKIDIIFYRRNLDSTVAVVASLGRRVHQGLIVYDHQLKHYYVSQVRKEQEKGDDVTLKMDWYDAGLSLDEARKYARGSSWYSTSKWVTTYIVTFNECATLEGINKSADDLRKFALAWAAQNPDYWFGGEGFSCGQSGSNCRDYTNVVWTHKDYGYQKKTFPCNWILKRYISALPNLTPSGWFCDPMYYNSSDGCDCDCGVYDPDCLKSGPLYGCDYGALPSCNSTGGCMYGHPPQSWICSPDDYATHDGCDCNCGAPDPDCNQPNATIFNCLMQESACINGTCVYAYHPPKSWVCAEDYYNSQDGCDCNCGAFDPDCKNHTSQLFNCPCSNMSCSQNGFCVGQCNGIFILERMSSGSVHLLIGLSFLLSLVLLVVQ